MWSTNNETSARCYLQSYRDVFREWLKENYKTLD
jgi:beta-galactosidase GanA